MLNRLFAALCVVCVFYSSSFAQPGAPDSTFGRNGRVLTNIFPSDDQGFAIQIRPDGRMLVAGRAQPGLTNQIAVLQFLPDGRLDENFNYDGRFITGVAGQEAIAYGAGLASDGSVTLAGFAGDEGFEDFNILRLSSAGKPDSSFAGTGSLLLDFNGGQDFAYTVLHQTDNKTIVAGYTSPDGFESDFALARLLPDGQPDPDFGDNGKVVQSFSPVSDLIFDAELQPNGYLVVAGQLYDEDFSSDFIVARYRPNGQLDSTFGTNGITIIDLGDDDLARGVSLQPDGKIVVAGIAVTDLQPRIGVARLQSNGIIDNTFGSNGQLILDAGLLGSFCTDVLVQPNGGILLSGMMENGDFRDFFLMRRLPDGAPDPNFGDNGVTITSVSPTNDNAYRLARQPDGKILLVGVSEVGAKSDFTLLRYSTDGKLDEDFAKGGVALTDAGSSFDALTALTIQSDGKILAGGQSQGGSVGSNFQIGIVRYLNGGAPDSTFASDGVYHLLNGQTLLSELLLQPDQKIVAAGAMNGAASLLRLLPDGTPDPGFGNGGIAASNFAALSIFNTLALQNNGRILAAGSSPNASENDILVQYLPNGNYDLSFGTNGQALAPPGFLNWRRLKTLDNGKFLALGSRVNNGVVNWVLVRFESNGAVDAGFGLNGQAVDAGFSVPGINVRDFAVLPSGKILTIGGGSDYAVARLNADGTTDTGFGNSGSVSFDNNQLTDIAFAVVAQTDGRIVVGGYSYDPDASESPNSFTLLRLESDGSLDNSFGVNGFVKLPGWWVSRLALQDDGSILAGGQFFNGHDNDFLIVRLLNAPALGLIDHSEAEQPMISLFPNPVVSSLQIEYELAENQHVSIRCYDDAGRLMTTFLNKTERPAGSHREVLTLPAEWRSGYYTLVVETGHGSKALKVIKL